MAYFLQDGIKVEKLNANEKLFYIKEVFIDGYSSKIDYYYPGDDILYDLDAECVMLYDAFQNALFPDAKDYYMIVKLLPIWVFEGGNSSDFLMNKNSFAHCVEDVNDSNIKKCLYLFDCQSMISSVQNLILGANWDFINFYRLLSEVDIDNYPGEENNGIFYTTQSKCYLVYSILNNFIISIYSIFDLLTKICYEYENLYQDFNTYPKLKSTKKLYGDKKDLKKLDLKDTIFESSLYVKIIISLRNELVHNAFLEALPKIFIELDKGIVKKRYILLPDMTDGYIDSFRNRKRFFSKDIKVNEVLHKLYIEILKRIYITIKKLNSQ